jgi:RNA polymerase-binding transcription factor DksA
MAKKIRLTPALLKKLVLEEKRKIQETLEQDEEVAEKVDAEEVEADEMADSLEQNIEWMAALKIQESILKRKYAKVQKAKKRLVKKINKK